MKRIVALLLLLVLTASMVACNSLKESKITCRECNNKIAGNSSFCSVCGAAISDNSSDYNGDFDENDTGENNDRAYKWDEVYLRSYLPKPKSNYGVVQGNSLEDLYMIVDDTSYKEFEKYVEACSEQGFNIDIVQSAGEYKAYSADGCKLSLEYFEYDKAMHISLEMLVTETFRWQDIYFAKLLPTPNSTRGNVKNNHNARCDLYIGEITENEYNSYIESCKDKGFTLETMEMDNYYFAKNNEGYELTVEYYGCNVIYLEIYDPNWESKE